MPEIELDQVGFLGVPMYALFALGLGVYCYRTGRTWRYLAAFVLGSFGLRALCVQATTSPLPKVILVTTGMLFIALAPLNTRSLLGGVLGGAIMVCLTFFLPQASQGTPEVLFYLSVICMVYGYFFVGQGRPVLQ